jgi:hypothetical protein
LGNNGGSTLETALVNIGVGIVAAAAGVWAGVQVHTSQIDDIKQRLGRIEDKVDRLVEREYK